MAARRAAKIIGGTIAAAIGLPVIGVSAYAEMEPGFKREVTFWKAVIPPMIEYYKADSSEYKQLHQKYAPKAVEVMLDLGGLYIKFGQICAVRPEFVPKQYRDAFQALQSEVENPCTFEDIRSVIKSEFGKPLEDIFSEFDPEPIGRASIGQAHIAKLATTGEEVVVKVQYPDSKWKFEADIRALRIFVDLVRPEAKLAYAEFSRQFLMELDYECEARNLEDMYNRVAPAFAGSVVFPRLYRDHSSPLVITMSRIFGEELQNEVRRRLKAAGVPDTLDFRRRGRKFGAKADDEEEHDSSTIADSDLEQQRDATRAILNDLEADADVVEDQTPTQHSDEVAQTSTRREKPSGQIGSAAQRAALGIGLEPVLRGARFAEWVFNGLVGFALLAWKVASPMLTLLPIPPIRRFDERVAEYALERQKRLALSFTGDTIRTLIDVHGYEVFRARLFNADPHPGNILMTPDKQIGLIDYGQCKRLTVPEARALAHLILAIHHDSDNETVADAMRGCGFVSKNDNSTFLASFARLIFHKIEPHVLDHKWHMALHKSDQITQFPQSAIMVGRLSGILRGVGLTFMHNVSIADMWAPHAQTLLDEGEDAVEYLLSA